MPPKSGLTLDAFISQYGDVPVRVGRYPNPIPLRAAAQMISLCPADPEKLKDPNRNLRFLASTLGASLLPEHQHLLEPLPGES